MLDSLIDSIWELASPDLYEYFEHNPESYKTKIDYRFSSL